MVLSFLNFIETINSIFYEKIFKITSGVALVFLLSLTLSSFSSTKAVSAVDNGVIVEVVKGHVYTLLACGDAVTSSKSTKQTKNNQTHLITILFELPDGHCLIPEKKAYRTVISGLTVNFTPSGNAIAKLVINN